MEMTCYNGEEDIYTNKVGSMVKVNIIRDVAMAEVTLEDICNIFS